LNGSEAVRGRPPSGRGRAETSAAGKLFVAVIIVAIALFYLATPRETDRTGGDHAMYILHARNIATGAPYDATGYILNPHYPELGPSSYPPGYPLLLAPVYRLCGPDYRAMSAHSILLFVAFLPIYVLLVRRWLDLPWAVVGLLAVGMCPIFWAQKENITSDFTFLPFLYASLVLIDNHYREGARGMPWPLQALVTAVVIWFASAVRTVGLTVIPALLLLDLMRNRRLSGYAVLVTAVTAALVLVQGAIVPGAGGYIERLWPIDPGVVWYGVTKYLAAATDVWNSGVSPALRFSLFGLTGLAAVWSYVVRLRKDVTILETFIPFFVAALLLFPGTAARYLYPLISLYLFYALLTFQKMTSTEQRGIRRLALTATVITFLAVYGSRYLTSWHERSEAPAVTEHASALFSHIRESTAEDDVFVYRRPRVLALHTGRAATVNHDASPSDLWAYVDDLGAGYVVSGPEDSDSFREFLEASSARLRVVYENPGFMLMEIGAAPSE